MSPESRGTIFLRPEARARHLEPLVAIEGVRVEHAVDEGIRQVVLDVAAIGIARGELVALHGRASTTTTLLHLVAGLERPTRGRVIVDGADIAAMAERNRDRFRSRSIGMIHRAPLLVPTLDARGNVELALRLAGLGRRAAAERAVIALERAGAGSIPDGPAAALTPGERVLIAVARSLANDPLLLLADDPTAGLEPGQALQMWELLERLNHDGLTIVYSTADDALARRARRRLHFADGRLHREEESVD